MPPERFRRLVQQRKVPPPIELDGQHVWDVVALDRCLNAMSGLVETGKAPGKAAALEALRQ